MFGRPVGALSFAAAWISVTVPSVTNALVRLAALSAGGATLLAKSVSRGCGVMVLFLGSNLVSAISPAVCSCFRAVDRVEVDVSYCFSISN